MCPSGFRVQGCWLREPGAQHLRLQRTPFADMICFHHLLDPSPQGRSPKPKVQIPHALNRLPEVLNSSYSDLHLKPLADQALLRLLGSTFASLCPGGSMTAIVSAEPSDYLAA